MPAEQARAYLLKPTSYCNFDLPHYFHFGPILERAKSVLDGAALKSMSETPRDHEGVNYTILNNKDGRHAWRAFQLIHPALYVSLVHRITEHDAWTLIQKRFVQFGSHARIKCLSLPVESRTAETDRAEQVRKWWLEIEQRSIELSLEYEYIVHADVTDCYGAIYTHSIAWALHDKHVAKAKENRGNRSLVGNAIDWHVQDMRYGQTNGIPQGSTLMDLIAEMVLGYADLRLADKLAGVDDYLILRYRDDYRIFANGSQRAEQVLKAVTEVLIELGLRLNAGKTRATSDVIPSSIKGDKLAWMRAKGVAKDLAKHLLIIHSYGMDYPNGGSLVTALVEYYGRLVRRKRIDAPMPLVALCVDIAFRNPRTYPVCAAILGQVLAFVGVDREAVISKIAARFAKLPNTGHMEVWLQRITDPTATTPVFSERLCRLVAGEQLELWNSEWITSQSLRHAVDPSQIVDRGEAMSRKPVIPAREVSLFKVLLDY